MSDLTKKQTGYKTLRRRLKARQRAIKLLRNKVAWLELQLTLHYVEDRRTEECDETYVDDLFDDCRKCQLLRKMLDAAPIPLIPALSDCSQDEFDETVAVIPNSEATSPAGEDFTVTIDPSHHSLYQQQDADAPKELPRGNELFSRGSSEKICCILLVAVAILLVNWM
ncbi:hypothetical protein ABFA07_020906 [Porites harrisoni]